MSRRTLISHLLFGNLIRKYRLASGLTQQELAESLKLHRTYISGIERGEKRISFDQAIYIIESLKFSIDDVYKIFKIKC